MKKRLHKWIPRRAQLEQNKSLRIFGNILYNDNIWHSNRNSVARGFSVGLFCAWVPVPCQMLLAAAGAILFNANLPLSVTLVWLTNPITMTPLFYFAYRLGALCLNITTKTSLNFNLSVDWLITVIGSIWQPFLFGCLILGILSSVISNIIVRLLWRYFILKSWKLRKKKRQIHNCNKNTKFKSSIN